jgi:hypothetical protein
MVTSRKRIAAFVQCEEAVIAAVEIVTSGRTIEVAGIHLVAVGARVAVTKSC